MHFSHALRSGHISIKIWSYYLKIRKSSYFVMLVVITLVRARNLVFLKFSVFYFYYWKKIACVSCLVCIIFQRIKQNVCWLLENLKWLVVVWMLYIYIEFLYIFYKVLKNFLIFCQIWHAFRGRASFQKCRSFV